MVELQEEVTRAQAAAVVAGIHATQGAQRVSIFEDELTAARRARDMAEEKILSPVAKAATTDQRWEAVEEQCECLVHELTLLSLRGSQLCMMITGVPPLAPLHEGMRIAAAQHTEVATWLSVL
jgi:hypothetical protein